jgi:hypothetical protein
MHVKTLMRGGKGYWILLGTCILHHKPHGMTRYKFSFMVISNSIRMLYNTSLKSYRFT